MSLQPDPWRTATLILSLLFSSVLSSCQPALAGEITLLDGGQAQQIITSERIPLLLLTQAGVTLGPKDLILLNGISIPPDQPLPTTNSITLQIRRAIPLTLNSPLGIQAFETAAFTVGEALQEAGIQLHASDFLDPPAGTLISHPITITYLPARELSVYVGGEFVTVRSSAGTVGEALAGAGIPLIGLDYSSPSAEQAPPADGQIRIVRVSDSVSLALKTIPFENQFVESAEIELGQQQLLQPGQNGLAMTRTRIRYEDGEEVSRRTESESMVRPPQTRLVATGTKVVIKTTTIDGVTIEYWRAVQMYATSYSPCRSGVPGQCFSGTSLGLPVKKGVVAVDISVYNLIAGQQLYISGYGSAVVADVGGGSIIEQNLGIPRTQWIDLGYSDNDFQDGPGWVTVYFLTPVPPSIPFFLQ
jgi:uncharacterized protein YabE (DUF348 family)